MRVDIVVHANDAMESLATPPSPSGILPAEGVVRVGALMLRGTPAALRLLASQCERAAALGEAADESTGRQGDKAT
jgi:hypothetical protein